MSTSEQPTEQPPMSPEPGLFTKVRNSINWPVTLGATAVASLASSVAIHGFKYKDGSLPHRAQTFLTLDHDVTTKTVLGQTQATKQGEETFTSKNENNSGQDVIRTYCVVSDITDYQTVENTTREPMLPLPVILPVPIPRMRRRRSSSPARPTKPPVSVSIKAYKYTRFDQFLDFVDAYKWPVGVAATAAVALGVNVTGENCKGEKHGAIPSIVSLIRDQIKDYKGTGADTKQSFSIGIPFIDGAQIHIAHKDGNILVRDPGKSCRPEAKTDKKDSHNDTHHDYSPSTTYVPPAPPPKCATKLVLKENGRIIEERYLNTTAPLPTKVVAVPSVK